MKKIFPTDEIESELSKSEMFVSNNELGKSRVCARKAAGLALRYWLENKMLLNETISPFQAIELFYEKADAPPDIHQTAGLLLRKVDQNYNFPDYINLINEAKKIIIFVKSQFED
ncbi:MAG: hypothetical protein CL609_12515 [Anaerolineaceae bacterium]|nr:hypothetical protein [Anaerolineaceae bacterium]